MTMKTRTVTKNTVGFSTPILINTNLVPTDVGLAAVVTGTITYTIQHSFDDPGVGLVKWFNNSALTNKTTSLEGSYTVPITAVRINVTAVSGGSVTLSVVQSGP